MAMRMRKGLLGDLFSPETHSAIFVTSDVTWDERV